MKVKTVKNSCAKLIVCPGCKQSHAFYTSRTDSPNGAVCTFNEDLNNLTFSPSLLIVQRTSNNERKRICHSFVRNGTIEYLEDCAHSPAGETIELSNMACLMLEIKRHIAGEWAQFSLCLK